MSKPVDSTLNVKACANLDVSKDLEKCKGKCIDTLLDEQKEEENNETTEQCE